jgi:hypothetical protein
MPTVYAFQLKFFRGPFCSSWHGILLKFRLSLAIVAAGQSLGLRCTILHLEFVNRFFGFKELSIILEFWTSACFITKLTWNFYVSKNSKFAFFQAECWKWQEKFYTSPISANKFCRHCPNLVIFRPLENRLCSS